MEEAKEFEKIMDIYEQYPIEELIIHPRVQKEFYKNKRISKHLKRRGREIRIKSYIMGMFYGRRCGKIKEMFPELTWHRVWTGRSYGSGVAAQGKRGKAVRERRIKTVP